MRSGTARGRAPVDLRGTEARFSKRLRTLRKICEELEEILDSLPRPAKQEIEGAIKSMQGMTPDLHFMGVLHAVVFLLSEACLVGDEQRRFASSRARRYLLDPRVIRGLVNAGRTEIRVPLIEVPACLPCPLEVEQRGRQR